MDFCVFKPKTAYEMRISDWSSDVCSSDLSRDSLRRDARSRRARPGRGCRQPAGAVEAARQTRVRRGSGREWRTMNPLEVEAIRSQLRPPAYVRGTPAAIALWRAGAAQPPATPALDRMPPIPTAPTTFHIHPPTRL